MRLPSSLLLAALTACARPAPATSPPPPEPVAPAAPAIVDLEVARAATPLIHRAHHGPDVDAAIQALGRLADPAAVRELLVLLTAGDLRAARALGVAKLLGADVDPAAEAAILARWPTRAPGDRAILVEALGRLGTAAALPTLSAALREGPAAAREPAALALGLLARRGVAFTDEALAALVRATATDDPLVVYAATYALAHEHTPPADEAVANRLAELSRAADPEVRALALVGLTRRKVYPASLPRTVARAPSHLLAALARRGPQEPVIDPRPLFHVALDDPDDRVRVAAVRGLLARGDDADVRHLLTWSRHVLAAAPTLHPILETLTGVDHLLDRPGPKNLSDRPGPKNLSDRPGPAQLPATWRALAVALADAADVAAKNAAPDARERLARVACQARALLARSPAWRPPLTCPAGLPAHIPAVLTAERLARGLAPPAERLAHLDRLRRDPDPRVRAAAISATIALRRTTTPPTLEIPDTWLLDALADPSPAVAGSLADALAVKDSPPPPLTDVVRTALAARALAELTREVELYTSLTAALAATGAPADACTAGLRHANPSVRAAARTCVTTLTGQDPGPQLPATPPARPPHAPQPGPKIHWRLTTTRGVIDVDLDPTAAPWHVAAIVAMTRAGFYDGLTFHRVVPGFVVQGGDPEGTGWGGPGYTLPSEPTAARFTRGAVGIADAGKDTGGCQFFFMQARAPHLEGRFTHIGAITSGLPVIDALLVGDQILRAELPAS